jgi:hypothetical protein
MELVRNLFEMSVGLTAANPPEESECVPDQGAAVDILRTVAHRRIWTGSVAYPAVGKWSEARDALKH